MKFNVNFFLGHWNKKIFTSVSLNTTKDPLSVKVMFLEKFSPIQHKVVDLDDYFGPFDFFWMAEKMVVNQLAAFLCPLEDSFCCSLNVSLKDLIFKFIHPKANKWDNLANWKTRFCIYCLWSWRKSRFTFIIFFFKRWILLPHLYYNSSASSACKAKFMGSQQDEQSMVWGF